MTRVCWPVLWFCRMIASSVPLLPSASTWPLLASAMKTTVLALGVIPRQVSVRDVVVTARVTPLPLKSFN